jgi:hypothetical protein
MMGTDSFPDVNFHALVRLPAGEQIIEFGGRESFKDCVSCLSVES